MYVYCMQFLISVKKESKKSKMDNLLLCNEVMSPIEQQQNYDGGNSKRRRANSFVLPMEDCADSFDLLPAEDCDAALRLFISNESDYVPEFGYLKIVERDDLVRTERFRAVNFIIKAQRRMDFSVEIVFTAVNYLDRFISLEKCRGWKSWMFELLSVACLSVAAKFKGTASNFLNEFQVNNDLENSFDPIRIQQMELTLMTALGWRMNSTTPFSYIHLMIQKVHDSLNEVILEDLTQRVTELLLNALLDPKFLEFKQSVMTASAIRCMVEEDSSDSGNNAPVADLLQAIIPQEGKDDVSKCLVMMEQVSGRGWWPRGPTSPVTVLKEELYSLCDSADDETKSSRKRKMEERDCLWNM